jgi:hypothetical protein
MSRFHGLVLGSGCLRMRDLLEKFRVATFVRMQAQCSVEGSVNSRHCRKGFVLLFPIGLFQVAFRGIGLYLEKVIVFAAD